MKTIPSVPSELVELMKNPFIPQRAFSFRRDKWLQWLAEVPGAVETINELPDQVDRAAIKTVFAKSEANNIEGAFTSAMIWGYGKANYGPSRTLRILSDEFEQGNTLSDQVAHQLRHSVNVARSQGSVAGYSYLNNEGKIRRFGPSFFTKWLYYATATGPQGEQGAAPILDDLVIDWFADIGVTIRKRRTPDYESYIDILSRWGNEYDLTAVDVEERIFRLIRGGTN